MLCEVMRDFLIRNGFEVSNCEFGNLNMAIYLGRKPDVIVLDSEDLEKFKSFFDQLVPSDRKSVHQIPIILFSSTSKELYATCAGSRFERSLCPSENIAEAIVLYASKVAS